MTAPLTGTGMMAPEANAAEQSRMELQAKLNGLGGLNGKKLSPEAREKKLREACEGFESIFIQKMWQEMRNAVPKTGILTGREERFWQDMYDQELSRSMTRAGGIGLADMMYEQLSRNLVSASRSAAGSAMGGVFMPSAAPLIAEGGVASAESGSTKLAASIYDGEAAAVAGEETEAQAEVAAKAETAPAASQAPQAAPVAAPQAAQPAPLTAPQAEPVRAEAVEKPKKRVHRADLGQASGLQMAQKARREAGDKLGSQAVRPASQRRRQKEVAQEEIQTAPVPGSADALRAAMEMARTGAATPAMMTTQPLNLGAIVANAQAMNVTAPAAAPEAAKVAEAARATEVADAQPQTRTVRYTTNIPPKADTRKKSKQAIRMLNVDNVGVNSKQGKGIAAYHAQQEAAQATSQASAPLTAQAASPAQNISPLAAQQAAPQAAENAAAAIPPLTPRSQETVETHGNFSVPPLTASGLRG